MTMDFDMTPIELLVKHHAIAKSEVLQYAYIGNVTCHSLEHTCSPECNTIAIQRFGFDIVSSNIDRNNSCMNCGNQISIVDMPAKKRGSLFRIST
jgi:pyruvate formate lyase activating enzyme